MGFHHPRGAGLDDISLDIAPGEAVAIVGPSGAGKSTLLDILGLSLPTQQGSLWIDGQSPGDRPRVQRTRLGRIHQPPALVPTLQVIQNVAMGGVGRRSTLGALRRVFWPTQAETQAIHAQLEPFGVQDQLYQRVDRLSGGEAQRVALVQALHQRPHSLLADEPLSALDPTRAEDVLARLLAHCAAQQITLVASLHNLDLARARFPRMVGLRAGRIAFDCPSEQVDSSMLAALYQLPSPASAP